MASRLTKQKQIINQTVLDTKSFFSAEDLHKKVLKKDSNIGIATVYRFLKEETNNRFLHSYLCNRKRIYTTDIKSHCHFLCKICNSKSHIEVKKIDFLKNQVKGKICHFQLDVTGVCSSCKQKGY